MKWSLLIVALVLAACGEEEREAAKSPPANGSLAVYMTLPDGPIYIEGSTPVIRIERPNGTVVLEEERPIETLDRPVFEKELPAGDYVLDVVQRPCEGNCGYLDPPDETTRCRTEIALDAGTATRATIELRRNDVSC